MFTVVAEGYPIVGKLGLTEISSLVEGLPGPVEETEILLDLPLSPSAMALFHQSARTRECRALFGRGELIELRQIRKEAIVCILLLQLTHMGKHLEVGTSFIHAAIGGIFQVVIKQLLHDDVAGSVVITADDLPRSLVV